MCSQMCEIFWTMHKKFMPNYEEHAQTLVIKNKVFMFKVGKILGAW